LPPAPRMAVDALIGSDTRVTVPDQVPLPRIYLAHRIPPFGTDAFDALDVAADVLGSGRASRLYGSLVREQRLAQDASVFVFPIVGGASMFTLWVTARPGVAPATLEAATLAEIDRLASDGPTDPDLERVRNLHASHAASALERIGERADRLSMYTTLFDEPERVNAEVSRYTAVDAARVGAALRDSVRADNRVTLTYVPAEAAS
jgi:zinc protease